MYQLGISRTELLLMVCSVGILMVHEFLTEYHVSVPSFMRTRAVRWSGYYALLLWILYAGYFVPKTFIYFQF